VLRITMAKKKRAKLAELSKEMRRRMLHRVRDTGAWLRQVLTGHFQYYGVPRNMRAMTSFRHHVLTLWRRMLRRRSQKKNKVTWAYMERLAQRWLPAPSVTHSYPSMRMKTLDSR